MCRCVLKTNIRQRLFQVEVAEKVSFRKNQNSIRHCNTISGKFKKPTRSTTCFLISGSSISKFWWANVSVAKKLRCRVESSSAWDRWRVGKKMKEEICCFDSIFSFFFSARSRVNSVCDHVACDVPVMCRVCMRRVKGLFARIFSFNFAKRTAKKK